ncbi:MAG: hypothetical protein ACREXP_01495 [Steroidobacteraceae bacterium]
MLIRAQPRDPRIDEVERRLDRIRLELAALIIGESIVDIEVEFSGGLQSKRKRSGKHV